MRIVVKKGGYNIRIALPTGLVLNRLGAGVLVKQLSKYGIKISRAQMITFIKEVRTYRKANPQWVLTEIWSSDGDYIEVNL